MIFGAERGFQKTFDDLAVGEDLFLGALALRDGGNVRECRARHQGFAERDRAQRRRERPYIQESAERAHSNDAAAIGACVQG